MNDHVLYNFSLELRGNALALVRRGTTQKGFAVDLWWVLHNHDLWITHSFLMDILNIEG